MKASDRKIRVQILMTAESESRLNRLVEETESASLAEVTRNALRLYEAVIDCAKQGRPLYQEIDGTMVPVLMVGPYSAPNQT